MFENDIKRIKACIDHNDYFSALEYAIIVKDRYIKREKRYFERIIEKIKVGDYKKIN